MVKRSTTVGYGMGDNLINLAPTPIIAKRDPTNRDLAELGTLWVNTSSNVIWGLANVTGNLSNWTSTPAAGATILASLTVNPGNATITAGNLTVSAGDLNVTSGNLLVGGNETLTGDLVVSGATTLGGAVTINNNVGITGNLVVTGDAIVNGDFDLTSTASISLTSTDNAAGAISLIANGGAAETILINSLQGTGAASLNLVSALGGITLRAAGLASADAINLEAVAGGIDMDSALQTNITSSQAAVNALRLFASDAAGGIDIDSGTGGITVDSTGALSLDAAAASNLTVTGAGIDLALSSVGGSVLVESTENAALAIRLHANGGTSETIQLHADQGTSVGSINLLSDVGGLTLRATGLASADAINLEAPAGGIDADAALQINIASSQAASTAIVLSASDVAGGVQVSTGGGPIALSSLGNVTMVPATNSVAGTTLVLNARVGVATFTGLTTAAAATETLTITNSALTAGQGIFCTVSNMGSNDAQMTLTRVNTQTAGSLIVQARNNGAAALNGNLIVSFWSIN